ncbi:MAG: Gfo/Idh/MocA family oxidoreductase [Verrucomicrobiota bacterium]
MENATSAISKGKNDLFQGPFTLAILGAGDRGQNASQWIFEHADQAKVVAVAEPNPKLREKVAQLHGIPLSHQFETWEDLLAEPKMADAVINTLMDQLHVRSAVMALHKGYHMMLEKPMATTLEDCQAIDRAQQETKKIVSVWHSMRHHVVYTELKRLLDEKTIGELVTFDQLEAVDPVHQSHSFVRGNWGNQSRSTFMLMAKSCHDIDVVTYLTHKECLRVSSFGSLTHFRKENAPEGAPALCSEACPAESKCPYSIAKVYCNPSSVWNPFLNNRLAPQAATLREKREILNRSPYGRCVYHCDNDVVDHQVVNFEYEGGVTGTFTMTAFASPGGRHVRLHGTKGWIRAHVDGNHIEVCRYLDGTQMTYQIPKQSGTHGGADGNILANFISAIRHNDPDMALTTVAESLKSHKIVFAAEKARLEKRVVEIGGI